MATQYCTALLCSVLHYCTAQHFTAPHRTAEYYTEAIPPDKSQGEDGVQTKCGGGGRCSASWCPASCGRPPRWAWRAAGYSRRAARLITIGQTYVLIVILQITKLPGWTKYSMYSFFRHERTARQYGPRRFPNPRSLGLETLCVHPYFFLTVLSLATLPTSANETSSTLSTGTGTKLSSEAVGGAGADAVAGTGVGVGVGLGTGACFSTS